MHVRFTEVLLGMLLSRKNKKEKKETNVMVTGGREVSLGAVLIDFVNLTSIYSNIHIQCKGKGQETYIYSKTYI